MQTEIEALRSRAMQELEQLAGADSLTDWKVRYLGKKGEVTALLRGMGQLSAEERPVVGSLVNQLRTELEEAYEVRERAEKEAVRGQRLETEMVDITLPGRALPAGTLHPLAQVIQEIEDIFIGLGFSVAEGPEVELDVFNFEMLNIPKDHPARDMQDTFYITEEMLMRTQTSPV
ncbi:MAG: pheS, partial [Bacilli bacterium]|nr:pheS [Bacilli bacterium]